MNKHKYQHVDIRVGQNGYVVSERVPEDIVTPVPYVFESMGALQSWLEERLDKPTDPDTP